MMLHVSTDVSSPIQIAAWKGCKLVNKSCYGTIKKKENCMDLKYSEQPSACAAFFLHGYDYEFRNRSFTCLVSLDAVLSKGSSYVSSPQVFTWLHVGKLHSISSCAEKYEFSYSCSTCLSRLPNENAHPYYRMCTASSRPLVERGERERRQVRVEDISTCIVEDNVASLSGPDDHLQ